MNERVGLDQGRSAGLGLRLFDWNLAVATAVLLIATLIAVPMGYLVFTGRGTLTVDTEIDPPYTVQLHDGRAMDVAGAGGGAMIDFPVGEEHRYLDDWPSVRARVKVDPEDIDARAVLASLLAAWLMLSWVALINLRRVVQAARVGEPFHPRNVARLRWLAGAVLVFPVVTDVMTRVLEWRLDADPPVHVLTPGPSWWVYVIVGLGLLALAEVFREGAALRELEQTTI